MIGRIPGKSIAYLMSIPGINLTVMLPHSVTAVLVGRVTLHLRSAVYGPPNLNENTIEGIPLSEISRRKDVPQFHRVVHRDIYESTMEQSTTENSASGREVYA